MQADTPASARFFIAVLACALLGSPRAAVGQPREAGRLTIDELTLQLQETQAALDDTRTQLDELLRQQLTENEAQYASYEVAPDSSCPGCGPTNVLPCGCNCRQGAWTKGGFQLTPYGAVYGEMLASESTFSLRGSPLFLVPGPAPGIDDNRFTVSGQQSLIGLGITGPDLGGLKTSATIAANFFGEQPIANNPGLFFLLAYGELSNEHWRLWFGQAGDAIGRQNTNSPSWASHKMQGNFGQLRPGFRVERYFNVSNSLASSLYFGLTQQAVNDFIAVPGVAGVDNGWPNVELRWETTLGQNTAGYRPVLIALGGLIGETRAVDDAALIASNVSTTWAVIPELRLEGQRFGFQGEAFVGQAIGTYNGAIGQSLNPDNGEAIYSTGGFGEVFWKITPFFTASVGYGIDNPRDRDLGLVTPSVGQRSRNESYWVNFIWRISEEWESRFEVSHLETDYIAPSNSSDSMIYHFLLRYAF